MKTNLGSKLKQLRARAELSQSTLAERAGVSPAFVYKLEAGEYDSLSIDKSRQLAKGLQMTFRDFLEAVGVLEESGTPQADLALSSALRSRKLTESQVKRIVSFVNFEEEQGNP